MIIIADSGSTKTTWMKVESGNKVVTEGLNPHFTTDEAFLAACQVVRQQFSIFNFQFSIYFYGSGCGSEQQRNRVASLLSKAFGTSDIHVGTDMLGACRAVCGREAGLVGILGTGSNACYYDGTSIVLKAPSLGYVLGDHGSANHVGRLLLTDYLTDKMPDEVSALFHEDYGLSHDEWIDAVYHQPNANRFLAQLATFAVRHKNDADDYCRNTIRYAFDEWDCYQLADLKLETDCRKISVVGGFGASVSDVLTDYLTDNFMLVGNIVADPIDGLRRYHKK